MCTSPIHIQNRKVAAGTFLHGADRYQLAVPCGHCPQCNNRRVDELVFRCYFEYLDTLKKGGFTIFNTLTYSEPKVPYNNGFRYFCKRDLQRFLKRLRVYLGRLGYDVDGNLKYVITSEYGEDEDSTHRPHYHVLFFVTFAIDPEYFDACCTRCWSQLDKVNMDRVVLGHLDCKQAFERVINRIDGIRYVCKYIGKGTSVANAIRFSYRCRSDISLRLRDWCDLNNLCIDDVEDWQLSRFWRYYRECYPDFPTDYSLLPFVMQSNGIGISFIDNIDDVECYKTLFDVVNIVSPNSSKGYKSFRIPMYYIRKVFYNFDKESKRFILNELGREYIEKRDGRIAGDLSAFVNIVDSTIDTLVHKYFPQYVNMKDMCDKILDGRDPADFVNYAVYLRDREISPLFDWLDLPNMDVPTMTNIQRELESDSHVYDCQFFEFHKPTKLIGEKYWSDFAPGTLPLYNSLPQFRGFDELFSNIEKVRNRFVRDLGIKLKADYEHKRMVNFAKAAAGISAHKAIVY